MKQVRYIFPIAHHYRLPFHEGLRDRLAAHDIEYRVVYSDPPEENRQKGDTVDIPWGIKVPTHPVLGSGLQYQHGLREALRADLTIVQQENKLALNYLLNVASMVGLKRLAYFGHGRNFQSRQPNERAERWKRFWATKVDWWFGYTEETRRHVESLGFPPDRITVFNNSVDTRTIRDQIAHATPERLEARRRELGLASKHVGIFVGGLYEDKRLGFLVEAARRVRAKVNDFELLVIGGGPALEGLRADAAPDPWIRILGPRFGQEKVELMLLGQLFLMPGLVGLAILDAAAAGLPMITTAFPYHSPEIAYLEDGVSGLVVRDWEDPAAYGDAVATLLTDPARLRTMRQAARAVSERFTIEAMTDRFAQGVIAALAPK